MIEYLLDSLFYAFFVFGVLRSAYPIVNIDANVQRYHLILMKNSKVKPKAT